ncbi:unnamed protein product [Callosobruchus maculatus]|uniref:C2H2-type domain-containing protein n=1 Tax=Callosobruchus maculatus TaxID=64391 RepID=A0A653C1T7_CALMS|nr:unnamed protein product [Callosobruchus maculatus]
MATRKWNIRSLPRNAHEGRIWAESEGLIPTVPPFCSVHKQNFKLFTEGQHGLGRYKCPKKACKKPTKAVATGTWFEQSRLQPHIVAQVMYGFAHDWSFEQIRNEAIDLSLPAEERNTLTNETLVWWSHFCREMIVDDFSFRQSTVKLGGPGKIVQIDESKFGRSKYGRGRRVDGHWVVGMIEDGRDEVVFVVVPTRDSETLLSTIQQWVHPGTEIHTDCWRGYNGLAQHGYIHKTVNHSDEEHGAVNEKYPDNGLEVGHRKAEGELLICYTCNYAARCKKSLEKHIAARNCRLKTSIPAYKHVCSQCNRAFARKENLDNHVIRIHSELPTTHSRKLYVCSICNYKTVKKSNYDRHTSAHSSDRQVFSCNYCSAAFTTKHNLNNHIMRKHPNTTSDTVHKCSDCTYKTVKRNMLNKHIMLVHPDVASGSSFNKCTDCDATFKWRYKLDDHKLKKHPGSITSVTHELHECPECTYKTVRKSLFDRHIMLVHPDSASSTNKCLYCDAKFKWAFNLDDHIVRKHPDHISSVNRKIYKCSECTYKTLMKGLLDSHIAAMNHDDISKCEHCTATFQKKHTLDNHIVNKHPDFIASVKRKIYQCPSCTYKTIAPRALKRHLLVHSSASSKLSISCVHCKATFCDYTTLDNHMLKEHPKHMSSVTGTLHECPQSPYKTIKKSNLVSHKSIHPDTPSMSVSCIHCTSTFTRKSSLDDHILKKHPTHKASVTSIVHECSQCTYKSVKKGNLNAHIRSIHPDASSSARLNACKHCNAAFKKKVSLDGHIIKHHPDLVSSVTSNVYQCTICPYKTTLKTLLDCHLLVHLQTTSRRKTCTECHAIFGDKRSLDSHIIKNHPNAVGSVTRKVYQCSQCEYKTVRKCRLDEHATSVHNNGSSSRSKPNVCIHCNASFKRSLSLDHHIIRQHPDVIASVT